MAEYTIGPVSCTATDPGTGLHEFSGRVILNTTTDTANNATTINSWRFEIYITRSAYISHYTYQSNNRCTVVINGQTLVSSSNIMTVAMEGRYESGNPGPLVLCSGGNITVPHNSDGTKSLAVSANYTQTGSGNYIGTIAPSGTITLETITRADVISTAPALTLAGSGTTNHTVSWTNSGSFYHSIEYKYGSTTLTTQNVSGTSATSYTYAVPASWASNVTNAKTMTVTAVLHSYSDSGRTNELGSNSKTFVVTFADSFAPTFGTATLVQNDRLSTTVVAGQTYTKVTVTPSYKNSATYKSGWAVYMDGTKELGSRKTGNPASGITLDKIPAFTATSKSLTIKYSVTDSRGFTATGTSPAFTAYGWVAPSITSLSAVRCNSSGTADLSGSNFKVTLTYSIRALNNANAKTILVKYRWNSQSTFTQAASATPTSYSGTLTLGPYGLSNAQDDKLIVRVEVYDSLSTSNHTTADTTVLPASVFMDIMTNGDKKVGLAVGMVNSKQNTVQLGWPLEVVGDGRAVFDPDDGITFYNAQGTMSGKYSPNGSGGGGGGGGLSAEAIQALLDCFTQVAWVGNNGQSYYDALETALQGGGSGKTVLSITAVFDPGQNVIYTNTQLNTLKQYLTVTASYSDSTTGLVTAYTLSGTLTAGTSTITVSYAGKTTTFTCTVVQADTTLYNWNFQNSIVDTKQGLSAVLGSGATRSSSGVTLNGTATGYIYLADMTSYGTTGYTIEVDVTTITIPQSESNHTFINLNQSADLSSNPTGLIYSSSQWWVKLTSNANVFFDPVITDSATFNGHTVKLQVDFANRVYNLYVDNVLLRTVTAYQTSNGRNHVGISGSRTGTFLGSGTIIKAVRIHEGIV